MKFIITTILVVGRFYGSSTDFNTLIEVVNSSNTTWKAGHNFDPSTPESYIEGLLGAKEYYEHIFELGSDHSDISHQSLPEEFDARKHWPHCPTIGLIRDQGNCGSCWAVAAAAAFSDRYCIATNGNFTLPLSDEEVLSCCHFCGSGCKGGFPMIAWKYFAHYGIVTGGTYQSQVGCQPYEVEACEHHVKGKLPNCKTLPKKTTPVCRKHCTNPYYESSFDEDHKKVDRFYRVKAEEKAIQKEILHYGPVEAVLKVFTDFTLYKSGVYHHVTGEKMGGHAVRIVGWGTENEVPYWLLANSWNTHWGDKGFVKILRGQNHCGIESFVIAGIPQL